MPYGKAKRNASELRAVRPQRRRRRRQSRVARRIPLWRMAPSPRRAMEEDRGQFSSRLLGTSRAPTPDLLRQPVPRRSTPTTRCTRTTHLRILRTGSPGSTYTVNVSREPEKLLFHRDAPAPGAGTDKIFWNCRERCAAPEPLGDESWCSHLCRGTKAEAEASLRVKRKRSTKGVIFS